MLNNRITVICHGNGISARANRNAVRKYPTLNNNKIIFQKGGNWMDGTSFMSVDEVAQTLGVSKSYAYKIVHQLNAELKAEGYLTISGRVNKQYFIERTCYGVTKKER